MEKPENLKSWSLEEYEKKLAAAVPQDLSKKFNEINQGLANAQLKRNDAQRFLDSRYDRMQSLLNSTTERFKDTSARKDSNEVTRVAAEKEQLSRTNALKKEEKKPGRKNTPDLINDLNELMQENQKILSEQTSKINTLERNKLKLVYSNVSDKDLQTNQLQLQQQIKVIPTSPTISQQSKVLMEKLTSHIHAVQKELEARNLVGLSEANKAKANSSPIFKASLIEINREKLYLQEDKTVEELALKKLENTISLQGKNKEGADVLSDEQKNKRQNHEDTLSEIDTKLKDLNSKSNNLQNPITSWTRSATPKNPSG